MTDGNESHSSRPVPQLSIDGLRVVIDGQPLVHEASLTVDPGTVHCLVGDSGSGKTLTSLACMGLLPAGAATRGAIRLAGLDQSLLDLDDAAWCSIRGRRIGYVGQNAIGCLHPAYTVGFQLVEAIRRHQRLSKREALALAHEELAAVDLHDPIRVAASYPAQLSGGMCQRVAIAIALCNCPPVLIADEPTTALDDATQDHVLDLIASRVERDGLGVLLITHDHDVVERMAHSVTSVAAGVTSSGRAEVERTPLGSLRRETESVQASSPVLQVADLVKRYRPQRRRDGAPAVLDGVSLSAHSGETVGLVGRSGAGKTTLARIVAGVLEPTSGSVHISGEPITGRDRVSRSRRADLVQYVFQDPYGSLNPKRTVVRQVAEPLIASGVDRDLALDRASALLRDVGLTATQIERRPTTLSGGQCQRVGIARALIRRPHVVVLDEPVSALDWSIRDEILAILHDLQRTTDVVYLLIAHERPLVEEQCDRIFEVADAQIRELVPALTHS